MTFPLTVHGTSLLSSKEEISWVRKVLHRSATNMKDFHLHVWVNISIYAYVYLLLNKGLFQPSKFTDGKTKTRGSLLSEEKSWGFFAMYKSLDQQKVFHGHSFAYEELTAAYIAAELQLSCVIASKNLAATGNLATSLNTWVPDMFEGSRWVDPSALYDAWQLLSRRAVGNLKVNPQHHYSFSV